MNEKKAREIVGIGHTKDDNYTLHVARGYIEAIEKAKGLVDCLKEIQRQYQSYSGDTDQDIEKAIIKWEEER